MDYDIDLDALAPQSKKIKWQDKIIEIKPPTTKQLLSILLLGQKNQKKFDNPEQIELDELDASTNTMRQEIWNIIPELNGVELGYGQMSALSELIVEMAMPGQLKELEKRGIKIDSPKVQAGS